MGTLWWHIGVAVRAVATQQVREWVLFQVRTFLCGVCVGFLLVPQPPQQSLIGSVVENEMDSHSYTMAQMIITVANNRNTLKIKEENTLSVFLVTALIIVLFYSLLIIAQCILHRQYSSHLTQHWQRQYVLRQTSAGLLACLFDTLRLCSTRWSCLYNFTDQNLYTQTVFQAAKSKSAPKNKGQQDNSVCVVHVFALGFSSSFLD